MTVLALIDGWLLLWSTQSTLASQPMLCVLHGLVDITGWQRRRSAGRTPQFPVSRNRFWGHAVGLDSEYTQAAAQNSL